MIEKQIDEEGQKAENLLESKNHYIKLLEQRITERFNQESQIREEIGKKLLTIIDDKFNALKIEVSKESMNRYECIENLKSYLENDPSNQIENLGNIDYIFTTKNGTPPFLGQGLASDKVYKEMDFSDIKDFSFKKLMAVWAYNKLDQYLENN